MNEFSRRGRNALVFVSLVALAVPLLSIGSRYFLMDRSLRGGQFAQAGLALWLTTELWSGKGWARVALAVLFTLGTAAGGVLAALYWPNASPALLAVTGSILLLSAAAAGVLWFSPGLRWHLAERAAREG